MRFVAAARPPVLGAGCVVVHAFNAAQEPSAAVSSLIQGEVIVRCACEAFLARHVYREFILNIT
jgi:hypothetical protein